MTNHLNKLRKELRSFAKRNKNFKYTEMSLFVFLMTRMLTFTQQTVLTKDIETKKQEINTSFDDIYKELKKTKAENNKLMKNYNLELIQLMEQGDHVVKSPWSSWQHGANYFYNDWNGTYKGRGDKEEKYPYLGTYTRSNNLFMRTISPNSKNFLRFMERNMTSELDRLSKLGINDTSLSAASSVRGDFNPSFGLESSVFDQEPVSSLTLLATVKPKQVNKEPVKVDLGTIEGPGDMSFDITPPDVNPGKPQMKTITFNYNPSNPPEKPGYTGFNMKFEEYDDAGVETITTTSHSDYVEGKGYTFTSGNTSDKINTTAVSYYYTPPLAITDTATPTYTSPGAISNQNYVRAADGARVAVIKSAATGSSSSNPFKIYFDVNSTGGNVSINQNLVIDSSGYRIDDENSGIIPGATNDNTTGHTHTPITNVRKTFLTGGSRIGSLNTNDGSITNNANIGLAGPLVSGLEIQTNSGSGNRSIINEGTISDMVENTSYRGKNGIGGLLVPVNVNGRIVLPYTQKDGNGKYKVVDYLPEDRRAIIEFPVNSEIGATIERTADTGTITTDTDGNETLTITPTGGYTGYKTGLVLTADHTDGGAGTNILTNKGTISFAGHHSIGIQIDADNSPSAVVQVLNKNGANITLGGGTSYGIKLSSAVKNTSTITNSGTITLGGANSAGIAVMEDSNANTTSNVRAWNGKVKNDTSGKIDVNNTNSIGMYLKLEESDDLTNEGTINVSGSRSTGMRADREGTGGAGQPKIINNNIINVTGEISFGMVALGNSTTTSAIADNTGKISLGGKQTVGMYAENGGEINNTATGNNKGILGTRENSIGMFIKDNTSKGTNTGIINVSGSYVKGVYNSGDFTMTDGSVTVSGANATGFDVRVAGNKTKVQKGTINVTGSNVTNDTNNAAVGFYIGDNVNLGKVVEIGDGTSAPTINIGKNALLVYNYTTDMNSGTKTQTGKLKPLTDTTVNVGNGGSAFAFKDITTLNELATAINNTVDNTGKKLNLILSNGSSLFTVRNFLAAAPTLANSMKLSELASIGGGTIPSAMGTLGITVNGGNYKIFTARGGHLNIDASMGTFQLDNNTAYDRVEFVSSSVTIDNGVTINGGTNAGRMAIAQKNEIDSDPTHLVVTNNGAIKMSNAANGNISAAAIAVERGTALNTGTGNIEMTGDKGVGMYGASNSKVENQGSIAITTRGAGIIGANELDFNTGDKSIDIKNTGTIKAVNSATNSSLEGVIGMYAKNTEVLVANSKIEHSGSNALIDFETNNATKSVGIYAEKSTVTASGNMNLKDENAGINSVNSQVTVSGGNYKLGNKSIGFILKDFGQTGQDGWFDGTGGTVDLTTGIGSAVYYFDNAKADTTLSSGSNGYFNDSLAINDANVTVPSAGVSYTYMYAKNTDLKYDKAAPSALTKDKVTFINATGTEATPKTKVELGSNSSVNMNGNEVIAVYLNNGISATNKGTITLNGNKSVALYGENGGALVNEKDISVNTNSVGIYNKDTTTATNKGTNSKIILLGDYGIGMRSDTATGDSLNEGKIESSKLRAIGISASSGSNSLTNKGEINFTGQQSIGMHTDVKGTSGHVILNDTGAKITLVDSADPSEANIGIYSEHSKDNAVNNGTIEAGHQTVGILSKSGGNVGLGGNSTTKVGDNAVAVFSNGGNIDIANGAKIIIGKEIGNNLNKESVGVYYAGSNGTITNNTSDITIGDGSYGFVIKGGLNNTLNSNNPSNGTVNLTTDAVYIYSEDNKGKVNNATDLKSSISGEINYGIYTNGGGTNSGNLDFSKGKGNVGIYSYFKDPNYKNNVNSKGEYIASTNYVPEKFTNTGIINVSASDLTNANDQKFGIGMAAGYVESRTVYNSVTGKSEIKRDVLGYGNIENTGTINVTTPNSIGMYAGGAGSVATNRGNINLSGPELNVGMFLEDGAVGHNYGNITVNSNEGVGIAVLRGAEIVNHPGSTITVNGTDGIGIAVAGGIIRNYGNFGIAKKEETIDGAVIKAPGDGAVAIKRVIANGDKQMGYTDDGRNWNITRNDLVSVEIPEGTYDATITLNGVEQTPIEVFSVENRKRTEIPTSSVGIYMDTSGVNVTRPVTNLGALSSVGIKSVDLIIGTEATNYTTEKYLKLSDEMIAPYNDMILEAQRQGLRKWEIYSGSLTWMATAAQNKNTQLMENVYLVKVPYTVWAGKTGTPKEATDTYNFLDGLEQRYGVEKEGRERELFKKLNGIGNNEHILLVQAFDEMMGHQYGNEQMRISSTGNVIDKEVNYLMKDWNNPSKQANKIKVFGMKDEFKTDTAGIIDYTNNAYGIAYVHEDEAIKLGNSKGWYAGIVNNRFKLKDIGKSKEEQNMLKIGIFKKMSPSKDYNGKLTWTISGEGFVGLNNMERRYLVVDDIFHAKSDFYTYGIGLKNEIGYDIRTSERTSIRPYAALDMEYGRFSDIKEDRGEIRLEVNSNDYYSIKPELGVEFKYKQPLAVRTTFTASLGAAYENELGKVGDVDNKARVRYTNANWFNIRGEKDDRKGNGKFDLKLGIENTRFGVTVNAGYDTKGENVRGGIGFRAIY